MGLVISGGTLVTASGRTRADLRMDGERITAIGTDVARPGDEHLDAGGCFVMPGGIDPHTHIEMPAGDLGFTADDWYSGTAAAVADGTTCVLDMITPEVGGTLGAALADWKQRAAARAVCDFGFHMGVIEAGPDILHEMEEIAGAGVPSFKIYLAYKGRLMLSDGAAFRVLREAGRLKAWTLVHCENGDLIEELVADARAAHRLHAGAHGSTRPAAGEGEATHRALVLAAEADAPIYIVHASCKEALKAIRRARRSGQVVRAEACAHHLVLTDAEYRRPGFEAAPYVVSPPLRGEEHREALWGALDSGVLDLVATDHCPWNLKGQKDRGLHDFTRIPNGAPGIGERMSLIWTYGVASGRWSPEEFVARTSANAARTFGLGAKGDLLPGFDADVVVWDPAVRRTLTAAGGPSRVDHSLYEGLEMAGQARYVTVRGRVTARSGTPMVEPGWGRFIRRAPGR